MVLNTRRILIGALIIIIILFLLGSLELLLVNNLRSNTRYLIQINDQPLSVELADTAVARYKGLSGRASLEPDNGMLFVFPKLESESFVMRDMKFPLDIIFIANKQIVEIVANAQPEGNNPKMIYTSQEPVDYVLELNANYAAKHDFKVGTKVYGLSFK